jgi:hypothetical protein
MDPILRAAKISGAAGRDILPYSRVVGPSTSEQNLNKKRMAMKGRLLLSLSDGLN